MNKLKIKTAKELNGGIELMTDRITEWLNDNWNEIIKNRQSLRYVNVKVGGQYNKTSKIKFQYNSCNDTVKLICCELLRSAGYIANLKKDCCSHITVNW